MQTVGFDSGSDFPEIAGPVTVYRALSEALGPGFAAIATPVILGEEALELTVEMVKEFRSLSKGFEEGEALAIGGVAIGIGAKLWSHEAKSPAGRVFNAVVRKPAAAALITFGGVSLVRAAEFSLNRLYDAGGSAAFRIINPPRS